MKKLSSGTLALIGVGFFVLAGATNIFLFGLVGLAVWLYAGYRYFAVERKN